MINTFMGCVQLHLGLHDIDTQHAKDGGPFPPCQTEPVTEFLPD
jgi:hypothetical protein